MAIADQPVQLRAAETAALPPALFEGLGDDESRALRAAGQFARTVYADKRLGTGEPAWDHALGIAANVAALRLDVDARVAGLLFAV
ncbi:MAG TPA: HD domain-containing protein, partial [Burkholderiales bacterium]|nr:HD domain-containing protein [Burkholderiales bacterium]